MRITMNFFIVLCYLIIGRLVSAKLAVKIAKKETKPLINSTALQIKPYRRNVIMDQSAYPKPLPTVLPKNLVMSPYTTLYQGLRYQDDVRVFRKRFDFEPMVKGQQVTCHGIFDCVISHIAIESTDAIPVLMRGGAGYRHFMAAIKAKPYHELKGQVRAYCRNKYAPPEDNVEPLVRPTAPRRRFYFGKKLEEENLER
ncbi:hypothetical protein PYW08_015048 [Mythimna loreyi]|uniref:Uncharacterized protein n=1 Tax=Mythimna loreyi TaxID=667449 RepID=A0ACC2R4K8_9NEOP|nr:hypothetical protein PYW08_015048 [Mythimna loreyi]